MSFWTLSKAAVLYRRSQFFHDNFPLFPSQTYKTPIGVRPRLGHLWPSLLGFSDCWGEHVQTVVVEVPAKYSGWPMCLWGGSRWAKLSILTTSSYL